MHSGSWEGTENGIKTVFELEISSETDWFCTNVLRSITIASLLLRIVNSLAKEKPFL